MAIRGGFTDTINTRYHRQKWISSIITPHLFRGITMGFPMHLLLHPSIHTGSLLFLPMRRTFLNSVILYMAVYGKMHPISSGLVQTINGILYGRQALAGIFTKKDFTMCSGCPI